MLNEWKKWVQCWTGALLGLCSVVGSGRVSSRTNKEKWRVLLNSVYGMAYGLPAGFCHLDVYDTGKTMLRKLGKRGIPKLSSSGLIFRS